MSRRIKHQHALALFGLNIKARNLFNTLINDRENPRSQSEALDEAVRQLSRYCDDKSFLTSLCMSISQRC